MAAHLVIENFLLLLMLIWTLPIFSISHICILKVFDWKLSNLFQNFLACNPIISNTSINIVFGLFILLLTLVFRIKIHLHGSHLKLAKKIPFKTCNNQNIFYNQNIKFCFDSFYFNINCYIIIFEWKFSFCSSYCPR